MATKEVVIGRLYDNCRVCGPDGMLMFRCNHKKINWYLRQGLAEITCHSPLSIRLKFQPKGNGNYGDPFYLQDKENRCCRCGTIVNLSKHHIVPFSIRRHLPGALHNEHDVLAMCRPCHSEYEKTHAKGLRRALCKKFGVPTTGMVGNICVKDYYRIMKMAATLIKHGKKLPADRRDDLLLQIWEFLGKYPEPKDLKDLARRPSERPDYVSSEMLIAKKVTDVEAFYRLWRKHFLKTMKPQFMPPHWSIRRSVLKRT